MIQFVDSAPRAIRHSSPAPQQDRERACSEVEQIAEIFETPLTGAYIWNYEEADNRLRKLYKLGKERNWNADFDIDWTKSIRRSESPLNDGMNPFAGYGPFERLDREQQTEFQWHYYAWMLSQFLHGEQGGLMVAGQLVSCAPTYDAKLYAASQTFDEARHVEVFGRYLRERVGITYPVNRNLKVLLDKILTDPRWDLKFIGIQLIIESLALAAFQAQKLMSRDPVLVNLVELVMQDEARHVAFGVTYMEQFVRALPRHEVEARAQFAYEACCVMRERIIPTDLFVEYGWNVEAGRRFMLDEGVMRQFQKLLFCRIVPNLRRVGLLTDSVRPLYDRLGVLKYENYADDGQIEWAQLEAPLAIAV